MTLHWSNAIPQAMQQHGSPPKPSTESEPATTPREALDILATLDQPGRFATSLAFEPKVAAM
jgi:hypothetical protein